MPGQEPLQYRAAREESYFHLIEWFQAVEFFAWKRVRSYFPNSNVKEIFCVTGQTLSDEYSISHQEYGESGFEVQLEGMAQLPPIINSETIVTHCCRNVVASIGFEQVARKSTILSTSPMYSVILQVFRSSRIQYFNLVKPLRARVESYYKCFNKLTATLTRQVLEG